MLAEQVSLKVLHMPGLVETGIIGAVLSGGNTSELRPNTQVMEELIILISVFVKFFRRLT